MYVTDISFRTQHLNASMMTGQIRIPDMFVFLFIYFAVNNDYPITPHISTCALSGFFDFLENSEQIFETLNIKFQI